MYMDGIQALEFGGCNTIIWLILKQLNPNPTMKQKTT